MRPRKQGKQGRNEAIEKKTYTNLNFYLWRLKYSPFMTWQEDVYCYGTPETLKIIFDSLQAMITTVKQFKHGTRKYKCNPPEDFNVKEYLSHHSAKIEWLEWLIIKLNPEISDKSHYSLQGNTVSITYNEEDLSTFMNLLSNQIKPSTQFPHGSTAPGGIYFAPDWLGAE